ncbi:MAG: alpha/beta hydrolase [Acidobacteriota bacterium]
MVEWRAKRHAGVRLVLGGILLAAAGAGAGCHAARTAPAPARHTVQSDGHPLALWEKRPPDPTRAILLIHGRTWSSLPDFDLQVPGERRSLMDALVQRGYAAYALDLRGYGRTPRDATGWNTPERAAADVASAVDWIAENDGLAEPPVLFGWSFGSTIAQLYAQRYRRKISALILFGYWVDPTVTFPPDAKTGRPASRPNTPEAAASDFITPGLISRKAVDAYVKAALAADPVFVAWRDTQEFNALDPAQVVVPTLLIQGEHDPYTQTRAQALFFAGLGTPDRQWVVIPGGDHAALIEDTMPAFVAAMASFIERPRLAPRAQ